MLLEQFKLFAVYNRLMNERLYAASGELSDDELRRDRGAFFKSVLGTLNHIMVGDIVWLQRFAGHPASAQALAYVSGQPRPAALTTILFDDLARLSEERARLDRLIIDWIDALSATDLGDEITYSNMSGTVYTQRYAGLISHLFLHQVHHRGQATTLLSQSGIDFGDTDLIELLRDPSI
ncbi:MAG: DinB family protein [Acidihalobacter sp.]